MDGLHDIWPTSSARKVSRPTRAPRRAAAAAASHPACPAPITRTSCMPRALADVPRGTLLSKAEASKERVEHILDAGAAGQPVEGNAGDAKLLGHQHEVAGPRRAGERIGCFGETLRLAAVQRDCVLGRKHRACETLDLIQQRRQALAGD